MLAQHSSGQIIPSLRRKRPDYIGIWAAQTAECYNLNPVMSQELNQALVLDFGKRTRHCYFLEPKCMAASNNHGKHRRSIHRRDLFDEVKNLSIRARSLVR